MGKNYYYDPSAMSELAPVFLRDFNSIEVPLDIMGINDWLMNYEAFIDTNRQSFANLVEERGTSDGIDLRHLMQENIKAYHRALRWASFGMPVFELTHSLLATLVLTDIEEQKMTEVVWPFPTFVIKVPKDFGFITVNEHGTQHPVSLVWVHQFRVGSGDPQISVDCFSEHCPYVLTSIRNFDDASPTGDWVSIVRGPRNDGTVMQAALGSQSDVPMPLEASVDGKVKNSLVSIKRLILNLCSYLTSTSRSTEKVGKWKHATNETVIERGVPHSWVVGRDIKLSQDLLTAARAKVRSESGGDKMAWQFHSGCVVRGHIKQQPHGPGHSLRRTILIAPYWRGPDGSVLVRKHQVD